MYNFNIEFEKIANVGEDNFLCDFCNTKINTPFYWCEFLVTGYCEKCMKEQVEEYACLEKQNVK